MLHTGLISECPALLPLFRDAFNEVYEDRARSAQQRAALLGLGAVGSDGSIPIKQNNRATTDQTGRGQDGRRSGTLVNFKNLSISEENRRSAPGGLSKGQFRTESPAVSLRGRGKGGSASGSEPPTNQMWQR